jgi:hypothetical protein
LKNIERIVGILVSGKPGGGQTSYTLTNDGKLIREVKTVATAPIQKNEISVGVEKFQIVLELIPELEKTPRNTRATWPDAKTIILELHPGDAKWVAEGDVPEAVLKIFNMLMNLFEE